MDKLSLQDPNRGFISTKTYMHNTGLSCTFRQWKANSHCRYLHGYALQVKFTFGAHELDANNWVVDFGGLKGIKSWLEEWFDHTALVASDDPQIEFFREADFRGILCLREVPSTGCESFAAIILDNAEQWLIHAGYAPRCFLMSVEVSEHGGNSAICYSRKAAQAL